MDSKKKHRSVVRSAFTRNANELQKLFDEDVVSISNVKVSWDLLQKKFEALKLADEEVYNLLLEEDASEEDLINEMDGCEGYQRRYVQFSYRCKEVLQGDARSEGTSQGNSARSLPIVNLMHLLGGMMLTWSSPVLPKLLSNTTLSENPLGRIITSEEKSIIASIQSLGGVLGPPIGGFIMEKYGRKIGMALTHVPNIIGSFGVAFGTNIWFYYIERVGSGAALGAAMSLGAFYLGEIGENHNRGFLYSSVIISLNLGCLLTYGIGPYMTIRDYNLILAALSVAGFILVLFFVPESPYYLVQHQKLEKAHKSLSVLKSNKNIEEEIKIIQEDLSKIQEGGMFDIFKTRASRTSFFISFVLLTMQQLSGVNLIYNYTQLIFDKAASADLGSDVSSILVGLTQFLTVPFGVEKFGRKKMLMFSSAGLACTQGLLGTFFFLQDQSVDMSNFNWIPIVSLILFFVFFNAGLAGIPYIYMSEVIPHNVKSASSSIIVSGIAIINFLILYYFDSVSKEIGDGPSFWVFAVLMAINVIFVAVFVYETQGKSFEEINSHFRGSLKLKIETKL